MKLRAEMLIIILTGALIFSCSKQNRQEFAKDNDAVEQLKKTKNMVSKDTSAVETDTLDVQDTSIIVFKPTDVQQRRLMEKDQDYVEYISDFENYTFSLSDDCHGKIPVYYSSARFIRIHCSNRVDLFDTKTRIHRKQSEDAGVLFLKGTMRPVVIKDVSDDYTRDIKKFFGISIRTDSLQ